MDTIKQWKDALPSTFDIFARFKAEYPTLDLFYSIVAASILWPLRGSSEQETLIKQAVTDDILWLSIRQAIRDWDFMEPHQAAQSLDKHIKMKDSRTLRDALDKLLEYFHDDWLAHNMLQPVHTSISTGDVSGGNVVIGGVQYLAGNLVIQHLVKENVRACPTAPNPPKHFTGREEQLQELLKQLDGQDIVAITALHAMGGMGKTVLAQALCHLEPKPFPTVLWAEVTQSPNPRSHLQTWGSYAKDDYTLPMDAPLEQIADYVRSQLTQLIKTKCGSPILVVLDDVWENGFETFELLRRAAPENAQFLITTRYDNVVQSFQAKSIALPELSNDEAQSMLHKLRTNRYISDAHIERIVSLINGHPLALELAAASLNQAEDTEDVEAILNDYERGINDGSPFDAMDIGAERPRTLNVVFGRSYNKLSPDHQRYFRKLGIIASDTAWDRPLAGAVWEVDDARALTNIHKTLRTTAFIQQDEDANTRYPGTWYRQHLLLRSYARALLNDANETIDSFACYTDYVTGIAAQFAQLPLEEWITLEPYLPHVHWVGDELVAQFTVIDSPSATLIERAAQFATHATIYLTSRPEMLFVGDGTDRVPQRRDWYEMGIQAHHQLGNEKQEAVILLNIGRVCSYLGEKTEALEYYKQALSLFQQVGHKEGEATSLNNIAQIHSVFGDRAKALDYNEKALSIRQQIGDISGEVSSLNNIGMYYDDLGDKTKALDYFQQALAIQRQIGDTTEGANLLNNIGGILDDLGDKENALHNYTQALRLFQQIGNKQGEATSLNNIGHVYSHMNNRTKALQYYEQALSIQQQTGDISGEAFSLNNIGVTYDNMDDMAQALQCYEKVLLLRQQVGDKAGQGRSLNNIAGVYEELGEKNLALQYYQKALPLLQQVEDKAGEALALNNMGLIYSDKQDKRSALIHYEQALVIQRELGDKGAESTILSNIGSIYFTLGDRTQALDCYEQALLIQHLLDDKAGQASSLFSLGRLYDDLGRLVEAIGSYEQALHLFQEVDDKAGQAITYYNMGWNYNKQGNLEEAIRSLERCVELEEQIQHPDLEQDRQQLESLKRSRTGSAVEHTKIPGVEYVQIPQETLQPLIEIYQMGGETIFRRAAQKAGLSEIQTTVIVQIIKKMLGE